MPGRASSRTAGGRFAPSTSTSRPQQHAAPPRQQQYHHGHNKGAGDEEEEEMFRDERVTKKRKLEIRAGPKQQTLDSLGFFAAGQNRPPNKVTITQPGGKLIETVNGVRNELGSRKDAAIGPERGRLGTSNVSHTVPSPGPAANPVEKVKKKEEKRTLRSQDDGPRLKSELAVYFPNYEDVMFDTPVEEELITVDSTMYISEGASKGRKTATPPPSRNGKQGPTTPSRARSNGVLPSATPFQSTRTWPAGIDEIDMTTFLKSVGDQPEDPLVEETFLKSHKRAERKEKQLRNIERERAMHEKVQLDRILDGLRGHDWLKVLGITGVTDSEARKYEPKRDYFIAEVQALVDKFKEWKDEEKRQRLEKEAALRREAEEEDGDEEDSTVSSLEPPSSDLNASASRQLQQETVSTLKSSAKRPLSRTSSTSFARDRPPPPTPIPYRPPSPITSFYPKRHLRDAALKKTRAGRNVTAFGQPLPDMEEQEFQLPEGYVTEDVLRASARERRRRKRESVANAASK